MSKVPRTTKLPTPRRGIPIAGAAQHPKPTVSTAPRPNSKPAEQCPGSTVSRRKQPSGEKVLHSSLKTDVGMIPRNNSAGKNETQLKNQSKITDPKERKKIRSSTHSAPPSVLRKQVAFQSKAMSAKAPLGSKVTAVAGKRSKIPPMDTINTPEGPQPILKKITTDKRVERTKHGEIVSKNIQITETDECTGETTQIEAEVQILNPAFPAPEGLVKETVAIVSEKDVTATHETTRENVVKETIRLEATNKSNKTKISRLVQEEREDLQNILRMPPPVLVNDAPELHPLKKRLETLRASPEYVVSLERSLVNPPISPDDVTSETTPELIATVMDAVDKSDLPTAPTERVFNSLFQSEHHNEPSIWISCATPGLLNDVVVPQAMPEEIHEGALSKEMEQVSMMVQIVPTKPPQDYFVSLRPVHPKIRKKRRRKFELIRDIDPPWCVEDLHVAIEDVGAQPEKTIRSVNVIKATEQGTLREDLAKGIEYMLDTDPLQYYSRVQLRGSQPPPWFPGYMMALTDTIKISKSPSEVMFSAWKSVQPKVFPDESIVYN